MRRLVALSIPLGLCFAVAGEAQTPRPTTAPQAPANASADKLMKALSADPRTAPYVFRVVERGGKLYLRGKVGSTRVHDAAIRIAIDLGIPVYDELVTDTAESGREAVVSDGPAQLMPGAGVVSNRTMVYPEPLFGRLDEPFAGMEPPAISYPPEWAAINARRPMSRSMPVATTAQPMPPLPPDNVDVAIDPRGIALLRGSVPTQAEREQIASEVSRMPGVTGVLNKITTRDRSRDTPPPPPVPAASSVRSRPEPAPAPIRTEPKVASPLENRVNQNLQRVPELRGVAVRAREIEPGVFSLSGRVAGPREAMLAYRSVQTSAGVRVVTDSLEFSMPEPNKPNPLARDVDPADLEPYLTSQLARHLGELAHVDRVTVAGSRVEIRGTLDRSEDKDRAEAVVRSIPLLRGFQVETSLRPR